MAGLTQYHPQSLGRPICFLNFLGLNVLNGVVSNNTLKVNRNKVTGNVT